MSPKDLSRMCWNRVKKLWVKSTHTLLWSINDLSKILCDCGRPEKAALMLEEIVPVVVRTLSEEHVGMFMTQSNLARAYALWKRWNEAEALLRKLTAIIQSDHPDWIHAMSGYIHVRARLGQLEETEEDCIKVLDVIHKTKILTLDNPRTLATTELLLGIYRAQERSDEILTLKRRVPGMEEHNDAQDSLFAILYGTGADDGKSRPRSTFW